MDNADLKNQPLMTRNQQCECNFCGGALHFDGSRAGELVNCQDCGMETIMFIPGRDQPYPTNEYLLEATNIGWSKTMFGTRNVVGMIVNTSNRDLDWVRVEFTLVNRQALPVGSTSDCLIDFPADGVWRFQAPVCQHDAVGVSAPLISCEFGKLFAPKPVIAARPAPPVKRVVAQRLILDPAPKAAPMQWTGIRIVGGKLG